MIELRFFRCWTQQEIADDLGITQMQVSRLLSALMDRLRDQLEPHQDLPTGSDGPSRPVRAS